MSPPGISEGDMGGVGRGGSGGGSSGGTVNNSVGGCGVVGSSGGTRGGNPGCAGGGDIITSSTVAPHHDLENLESCSRNPLLCLICNNMYDDPRLLACYHSFCAKCLQSRIGETKLICPLCGKPTALKDGSGPPVDHLVRFLLQATSDTQPSCANCDNKSRIPMYYCNTCGQALCNGCREETHRAKMFSAHDIIPVSKYAKEAPKRCSIHGEQYIMFSTVQKSMLCINCYRDTARDERLHCVDLDTAYSQGCRKLDRAVISLQDLQRAVRDGIMMLKNVLEEIRRNSDSEKSAVNAVCQTISDALSKTQENLLRDVDCQMDMKDKVIKGQLSQLRTVLPTIKLHLTMCATISNAASKYDFLDLAYPLIDRLIAITHMGYPIRPGQSSHIKSAYKMEIARTLEPWISGAQHPPPSSAGPSGATNATYPPPAPGTSSQIPKDYTHPSISLGSVDPSFSEPTYSQYYPMSRSTVTPIMGHKTPIAGTGGGYAQPAGIGVVPPTGRKTPTSGLGKSSKGDGIDDNFAAHCRSFTAHFNELSHRLNRLKEQVQELHRDVTLQRGTSYISRAESALREGLLLEEQLTRRYAEMEQLKKVFEAHWNEQMRQVREKQDVFQSQMNDLLSLRSEVKQLSNLLQQLQTFLKSMGAHHSQQHQPGGGGPPDGPSGGTSGGGTGGTGGTAGTSSFQGPQTNLQAATTATPGQSARPQQPQQMGYDNKSYHLSPALDSHSRVESSAQVTPSLGEMAFASKAGPSVPPKGKKEAAVSAVQPDANRTVAGRFTVTKTALPAGSPAPPSATAVGQTVVQQPPAPTPFVPFGQTFPVKQIQHSHGGQQHQQQQAQQTMVGHGAAHQFPQQVEMEYVQVDTSYQPHSHLLEHQIATAGRMIPISIGNMPEASAKKGVLSQLIDKVRSKDERKKSSASGVSSSSSGGTIPQPPQPSHVPPATTVMGRRALSMYDGQCQYGTLTPMDSATSAVAALALANSSIRQGEQRRESRPIYSRAKSFVKSKSDDERPPSKLSKDSRARSAGQLESESLLRSFSTSSSKDASRILSLYQGLLERENQQFLQQKHQHQQHQQHQQQIQQRQQQAVIQQQIHLLHHHQQQQQHQQQHQSHHSHAMQHTHRLHYPHHQFGTSTEADKRIAVSSADTAPVPKHSATTQHQQIHAHQQQRPPPPIPQHYQPIRNHIGTASRPQPSEPSKFRSRSNGHEEPEDDYQFLPMTKTIPVSRSQSAPPRKPPPPIPGTSTQQVRVYVHEEPRSTRSSPSATLSKSLEESYLYGYLTQDQQQGSVGGGLTPSSSGGQSGYGSGSGRGGQSAFTPVSKKPSSMESLVSLSTEQNSTGHSRKSSIDFDRRSVVTVRRAGSKSALITRQHSWEVGTSTQFSGSGKREQSISTPQLSPDDPFGSGSGSSSRHSGGHSGIVRSGSSSGIMTRSSLFYDDDQDLAVGSSLHKADSFEGHEEAVRSIVAAVQETRSLQRKLQSS
ncbi:unnamed protein product [Orchesella dallaii]